MAARRQKLPINHRMAYTKQNDWHRTWKWLRQHKMADNNRTQIAWCLNKMADINGKNDWQ
jgi:hypothetical protein